MSTPPGALAPHLIKQLREFFRLEAWVKDAACSPDNAHRFFPSHGQHSKPAKDICAACPVITQCRNYAINSPDILYGVWGGMSEEDMREERRRAGTRVVKAPSCGTAAGYRAHFRNAEVPCPDCRRAAAIDRANRRQEKRNAL